jgi:hypothetical protein
LSDVGNRLTSKSDAKQTKIDQTEKNSNEVEFSRPHSNSLTRESTGAEVIFFPCVDEYLDLEETLKEFISSIFFVLDGKRLDCWKSVDIKI